MVKNEFKKIDAENISVRLKNGRHSCNCQARIHQLIRNCLGCGRVVCEQEGSGPCFYCGRLVCTREERKVIENNDKQSLVLLRKLLDNPTLESVDLAALGSSFGTMSLQSLGQNIEEATNYKQKLLRADKDQEVTKVNDLQADYFNLELNPYLTSAEREAIVKRKEELRLLSLKAKRELLVDVDVESGTIQEKKKEPMETVNDPVIQSILVNSMAGDRQKIIGSEGKTAEEQGEQELIDTFRPKYEEELSRSEGFKAMDGEKRSIKSSRQKIYCIAFKQPFATDLLNLGRSLDSECFVPWRIYVEHRGPVLIAVLDDDDSVEHFNGNLGGETNKKHYPKRAIIGKANLCDCVTWDEFNHEFSSLPSFHPLDNSFAILLNDFEAFSSPIPHEFSSEFFELKSSVIDAVNVVLTNGLFETADVALMVEK